MRGGWVEPYCGSHDPLLEWALRESSAQLASLPEGSEAGLTRLAHGEVMAAAIHLHRLDGNDETANPDAVASLLAIRFQPNGGEDPGGTIEMIFSGGGILKFAVECIDAELADLSGEWVARGRPVHELES